LKTESSGARLRDRERANGPVRTQGASRNVLRDASRGGSSLQAYRIGLVLALVSLCSAWTCSAIVNLRPCPDSVPYPQIGALSPNPISAETVSVVLTVEGTGFVPGSEILWNQYPLPTTFIDSRHLQTTITQETFDTYGGAAGKNVWITVTSPGSTYVEGCSSGNSSKLLLEID
jgi:hypothetical protein